MDPKITSPGHETGWQQEPVGLQRPHKRPPESGQETKSKTGGLGVFAKLGQIQSSATQTGVQKGLEHEFKAGSGLPASKHTNLQSPKILPGPNQIVADASIFDSPLPLQKKQIPASDTRTNVAPANVTPLKTANKKGKVDFSNLPDGNLENVLKKPTKESERSSPKQDFGKLDEIKIDIPKPTKIPERKLESPSKLVGSQTRDFFEDLFDGPVPSVPVRPNDEATRAQEAENRKLYNQELKGVKNHIDYTNFETLDSVKILFERIKNLAKNSFSTDKDIQALLDDVSRDKQAAKIIKNDTKGEIEKLRMDILVNLKSFKETIHSFYESTGKNVLIFKDNQLSIVAPNAKEAIDSNKIKAVGMLAHYASTTTLGQDEFAEISGVFTIKLPNREAKILETHEVKAALKAWESVSKEFNKKSLITGMKQALVVMTNTTTIIKKAQEMTNKPKGYGDGEVAKLAEGCKIQVGDLEEQIKAAEASKTLLRVEDLSENRARNAQTLAEVGIKPLVDAIHKEVNNSSLTKEEKEKLESSYVLIKKQLTVSSDSKDISREINDFFVLVEKAGK